ncbi:MAG: hypothetical protein J6M56_00250 [Clostridia bacterium]|nr:hypothetical protein [Clostridia bacterium]
MMQTLKMLWSACPGENAACIAIAAGCAAMMAALLGLLLWPEAPDRIEET